MKYNKLIHILLSSTIIVSSLVISVSCQNQSKEQPNIDIPSNKFKKDSTQCLNLSIHNDPETLDPNKAISPEAVTILNAVNEGLVRVRQENGLDKIIGAGAKNWTVSKDNLTWTFNLRNYSWSDGKPVTAQHFVDSISRLLDSNNGFYYAYIAFDIKNAEKYYNKKVKKEDLGIKAINDKTLEITLERPTPHFDKKLVLTPFQPIRLDIINKLGDKYNTSINEQVYCGPFKITKWDKNSLISLEKNFSFWDKDNVYINNVNFFNNKDLSKEIASFQNKDLDIYIPNIDYATKLDSADSKYTLNNLNSPTVSFVQFNQNTGGPSGLMKNKNIRKALSLCIDREQFINNLNHKNFPAYGVIPNKITLNNQDFRSLYKEPLKDEYSKNKSSIKDLFKTGLTELTRSNLDINNYSLEMLIYDKGNSNSSIINWWKSTFEDNLGVVIKCKVCTDTSTFEKLKKDGLYDITFSSYDGDFNDPLSFLKFWATNNGLSKNYGGYSNTTFDKLFSKLNSEGDFQKRGKIYSDLEHLLICEDAAIAPYLYKETDIFSQEYVKDIFYPTFGPQMELRWCYISGKIK